MSLVGDSSVFAKFGSFKVTIEAGGSNHYSLNFTNFDPKAIDKLQFIFQKKL